MSTSRSTIVTDGIIGIYEREFYFHDLQSDISESHRGLLLRTKHAIDCLCCLDLPTKEANEYTFIGECSPRQVIALPKLTEIRSINQRVGKIYLLRQANVFEFLSSFFKSQTFMHVLRWIH